MLMLKILENDLHRSRSQSAVPLIVEVPARSEFLPALVSNSRGNFLVSRRLTEENRIRVGVFNHDAERIDELIPTMLSAAFELSKQEKWDNVFGSAKDGFQYVKEQSFMPAQPHVCIVPSSWDQRRMLRFFNLRKQSSKYRKYCHIVQIDTPFATFLSKPEMVGLYTHFLGGPAAILLHNVRRGMAFVHDGG